MPNRWEPLFKTRAVKKPQKVEHRYPTIMSVRTTYLSALCGFPKRF